MSIKVAGNAGNIVTSLVGSARTFFDATLPKPGTDPAAVGGAIHVSENDSGSFTGSATLMSPESAQDFRLRVGMDTILFSDTFNAAAQNTSNWSYANSTMTYTQPSLGYAQLGTVQGTANGHFAAVRSYQYFPMIGTAPIAVEFTGGQFTSTYAANEIVEFGLGLVSTAAAPTEGAFFRLSSAGVTCAMQFNGTEVAQLATATPSTLAQMDKYTIVVGERAIQFWQNDILLYNMATTSTNGQPFIQGSLPVFFAKRCTGVVANTNVFRISDITVSLLDIQTTKPWAHQMATAGKMAYEGQNGHTLGTTQFVGTITTGSSPQNPTAAAASNTAANSVGLGGVGAFTTLAAAATDFIATSYQNPAPTINITGRNLIITGISIQTINIGAAVATTPTTLLWSIGYGHTSVSMQTVEAAATHTPRRIQLGYQSAPIGAVVGAIYAPDIVRTFNSPIVVRPGCFINTFMKVRVGTATASQVIEYCVSFDGYWE